jgi:hypothetical protein
MGIDPCEVFVRQLGGGERPQVGGGHVRTRHHAPFPVPDERGVPI